MASFEVAGVLEHPELTALPRDLDAVTLWSGCGAIAAVCRGLGLQAEEFDKVRPASQDLTKAAVSSQR